MAKEYDIEDEKFEALLQDKRHKEIVRKLGELAIAITSKDDKELVRVLADQPSVFKSSMEQVINALQNIEPPQVNINYENLLTSFKKITDAAALRVEESNNKLIDVFEKRLVPYTFDLVKNYGITESVKVNYKPSNEIAISKSKYNA